MWSAGILRAGAQLQRFVMMFRFRKLMKSLSIEVSSGLDP